MANSVFIGVDPKLNMALVDKVLRDVKSAFAVGGKESATAFSTSFSEVSRTAELSFREMQRGMAELQVAEARVNAERVASFQKSTDAMIASEKELQAVLARTQKMIADSRAADAATMVPPGSRGKPTDRTPLIPVPRGANAAGAGVAIGVAGFLGYGIDTDIKARSNMNIIQRQQVGMPNAESGAEIGRMTQWAYQNAGQLGSQSSVVNLTQALAQAEQAGYRGQSAMDLVKTSFQEAQVTGAGFQETLSALNTQLRDTKAQTDKVNASLQQMQIISSQNVRAFGNVPLTPEQRSQAMDATHSYEPTLTALSPNADPASVLAQAQAAMVTMMMTGMSPDQSADNLSHFFQTLNLNPGSKAWQMYGQLGGNQQDLSVILQDQGPLAAFQKIQEQIQKATGSDGLVHTGTKFNNDQLNQLATDSLNNMDQQAQDYINNNPDVQAGLASNGSLRKAVDSGQLSGADAQEVLAYSRWRAQLTGMNPAVKKGGEADMTPTQVVQAFFGNADTARTFDILNQAGQQLADRLNSILEGGKSNILEDSFKQAMNGDVAAKWHALGEAAGGLAARLSNDLLPVVTDVVGGLKSFTDFLGRNKTAADALATVLGTIAATWGAAKVINFFSKLTEDLAPAFDMMMNGARTVGDKLSNRLPTQFATAGAGAETLGAAETTAAGEIEAAGTKANLAADGSTVLGAAETTTAGEITASGVGGSLAKVAGAAGELFGVIGVAIAAIQAIDWSYNYFKTNTDNDLNAHSPFMPNTPTIPKGAGIPNPGAAVPNDANPPTIAGIPVPGLINAPGHAYGGVVGQPLMGVPDRGTDSVLGMLPNGQPVGLRGGEGILTPETVQALGGEQGVNALNANPWSNPFKVGTTFYNSFAQGVAQYSPWGKYLAAAGQSLSSLEQASETAQKEQTKGTVDYVTDLLTSGGYGASSGGQSQYTGSGGTMGAIRAAMAGLPADQQNDVLWIMQHESGFNPGARNPSSGAYGLGQFLGHQGDKYGAMGAYSGDPTKETQAMLAYISDRYGSPGAAKQFWQAHHWYSSGGVIPLSPHKAPTPPKAPAPTTHASQPAKGPQKPTQADKNAKKMTTGSLAPILDQYFGQNGAPGDPANGDRNIKANPSQQLTAEGKGFGLGGGLLGAAESAAASAGDMFAPGSGQAAQPLFDLANRAIGYGGQLLGIGMEGLMETFLPNDSPGADPSKNIFGKMALGIAGAHPSSNNMAGSHAQQLDPKKDLDKGSMQAKQQPSGNTYNFHGGIHGNGTDQHSLTQAVNHANQIATFAGI